MGKTKITETFYHKGWRPAVGWVSVLGLAWIFILSPTIEWLSRILFKWEGVMPLTDSDNLFALVFGLLGLGGLRTVEKIQKKGEASKDPSPEEEI